MLGTVRSLLEQGRTHTARGFVDSVRTILRDADLSGFGDPDARFREDHLRLLRAVQRPLLEPLLHLTIWLSPIVWAMNWLSYLNGTAHLVTLFTGFAGDQTRGQLDVELIETREV